MTKGLAIGQLSRRAVARKPEREDRSGSYKAMRLDNQRIAGLLCLPDSIGCGSGQIGAEPPIAPETG